MRQLTLSDFVTVVAPARVATEGIHLAWRDRNGQARSVTGQTEHEMASKAISLDTFGCLPGQLETWEQIEEAAKTDPDLAEVVAVRAAMQECESVR